MPPGDGVASAVASMPIVAMLRFYSTLRTALRLAPLGLTSEAPAEAHSLACLPRANV